jgi:hypothetical protein
MHLELNTPDEAVTEQDIITYLHEFRESILSQGGEAMDVATFWQPGDFENWQLAKQGWPHNAPAMLKLPNLVLAVRGIGVSKGTPTYTFRQLMEMRWKRVCEWMVQNKIDPAHPNETAQERALRKAREGMARKRARDSEKTPPEERAKLERGKELYEAYLEACRVRKAVAKQQDALVTAAWDEFQAHKRGQ